MVTENQGITILVVDDEEPIRKLLRRCFEAEQYRVLEAATSVDMFELLGVNDVDLITLDLALGAENGLDIAKQIRMNSDVGIIVVSGKGDLIDTVVGLELGADDYISKPFELREVLARARSVLRRTRRSVANTVVQADVQKLAQDCNLAIGNCFHTSGYSKLWMASNWSSLLQNSIF